MLPSIGFVPDEWGPTGIHTIFNRPLEAPSDPASEVRAFNPDGSFRGRVAERGQGPGEIMQADGTLWVQDHGQWRLIRLEPEGGEAERIPMFVGQYGYQWDGGVDEAGRIWTRWSRSLAPASLGLPDSGPVESAMEVSVVLHHPTTGVSDTISVDTEISRSYVVAIEGGRQFRSIPFEASHLTAVDPAGAVWSAAGDDYRIVRLNALGDTPRLIEVEQPSALVTAGDRDHFLTAARDGEPSEEEIACEIVRVMPERKPALSLLTRLAIDLRAD